MLSAALLAVLLAASPAGASAIVWEAPLECPSSEWVATRVEAYLGRPLSAAELDDVIARGLGGRVEAGPDGRFEIELELGEASAQRDRVGDHDCRRVAELAASLLAIAIDPLALGEPVVPLVEAEPAIRVLRPEPVDVEAPAEPDSSQTSAATPSGPPEPGPEPSWELVPLADPSEVDRPARPGPRGRVRGLALADVGLAYGLFPNLAPEVRGGLGFTLREPERRVGLRVELEGGAALGGRFRAGDGRELGGDLLAWDVGVSPCVAPRFGLVDLRGCASVGVGQLRGRGVGVQNPQTIAQPWIRAGADLGVAVALRRRDATPRVEVAVVVDLGGGLHLLRPNFVILDANGDADVSYVMPLGSVHARLGFELRFF